MRAANTVPLRHEEDDHFELSNGLHRGSRLGSPYRDETDPAANGISTSHTRSVAVASLTGNSTCRRRQF